MRTFAIHDSAGNIDRLVVGPADAPPMMPMTLAPGQSVTEISLPEGLVDLAGPGVARRLVEMMDGYRVEVPEARPARIERLHGD